MGVGLQPLEFTECLADSPAFRDNLQRHEKELERTSQQIKRVIKEVKDVVTAAKRLSVAQLALADSMERLEFASIGGATTEDERVISSSLQHFAQLLRAVENERERMLGRAHEQIVVPLERFRKEQIGAVKEGKKKFDKKTAKFCQTQERTLSLSSKKPENVFQEADAALDMAARDFCAASLEYVCSLQRVQERRKYELSETLLSLVYSAWTFHHTAHDLHADCEPAFRDLQLRIQRTRTNFEETSKQTETLMKKMMDIRQTSKEDDDGAAGGEVTRSGYLFLMEKKAFGLSWSKQFAQLQRDQLTLTPYNQINVKATSGSETISISGARACTEPVERRFCFEVVPSDAARAPLVLQAASASDQAVWLRVLCAGEGGRRPEQAPCGAEEVQALDAAGFTFVRGIVAELEARGLKEQGLYRVAGVSSRVARLLACARSGVLPAELSDPLVWDSRTLTSALKAYLRGLPALLPRQPALAAAKLELSPRVAALASLVAALPPANREMLSIIVTHLRKVAAQSEHNLMTASNLAVCFGPTLLRADTDSVASILHIKFYNVLLHTLLTAADSPTPPSIPLSTRNDITASLPPVPVPAAVGPGGPGGPAGPGGAGGPARYSPHHQHMLTHFAPPHVVHAGVGAAGSSGSDSSSHSASPPPALKYNRVRTLYACLGESEGELSFEPNQVITHVTASAEPGWLRGVLRGRCGLLPENYVQPLP